MSDHVENGLRFLDEGNAEAALAAFSQALEAEPDNVDARYGIARAHAETNASERAIEDYRIALEAEPRGDGAAELAELLLANNQRDQAQALIDQAFELAPDHFKAYLLQAELAVRDGDYEVADDLLRKGIRRGAEVASSSVFGMYQSWVADMVNDGEAAKASEAAGRAAAFFKDSVHLRILAAGAAEAANEKATAIERYKEALADLPAGNVRNQILEKIALLAG